MAASTIATTTTLAGEQSPTLRVNMKSSSDPAPPKQQDQDDQFFWSYTEEPHRSRRMAIIKAHPEVIAAPDWQFSWIKLTPHLQVLKLCGPEPLTIPLVLAVVGLQCACAYLLSNTPFWSWRFWLTAYIIGATANQNLFLAIHEISHNLAFKSGLANRLFAIVANLPIGIPYSASFRVCLFPMLCSQSALTPHSLTTSHTTNHSALMASIPTCLPLLRLSSSIPLLARPSSAPSRSCFTLSDP